MPGKFSETDNGLKTETRGALGACVVVVPAIGLAIAGLVLWVSYASGPARAALEQQRRSEIARESRLLCEKWGHQFGTQKHAECVTDLGKIRGTHERRIMADADLL